MNVFDVLAPAGEAVTSFGAQKQVGEELARRQKIEDEQLLEQKQLMTMRLNDEFAKSHPEIAEAAEFQRRKRFIQDNLSDAPPAIQKHYLVNGNVPNWWGEPTKVSDKVDMSPEGIQKRMSQVAELAKTDPNWKVGTPAWNKAVLGELPTKEPKPEKLPVESEVQRARRVADAPRLTKQFNWSPLQTQAYIDSGFNAAMQVGKTERAESAKLTHPRDAQILEGATLVKSTIQDIKQTYDPIFAPFITGRTAINAILSRLPDSNRVQLESQLKQLAGAIVQVFGEGTRGFQKAGLEFNQSMIPKMTDNSEMWMSKLSVLQRNIDNRVNAVKKSNPKYDFKTWESSGTVNPEPIPEDGSEWVTKE